MLFGTAMNALRSSSLPFLSISVMALLLIAARPIERKTQTEYPDGGAIQLQIRDEAGNESVTDGWKLLLEYGRVDPLQPSLLQKSLPLETSRSISVMVHQNSRLLSLQKLAIESKEGSPLLVLSRKDLDPLRSRARTGAAIAFTLAANTFSFSTIVSKQEDFELPARTRGPGLAYSDADVLDLIRLDDVEDSLLRIRAVTAASEDSYRELIALAQKTPSIDGLRLRLLLDGMAFPAPSLASIRRKLRDLPESPEFAERRRILAANLSLGESLAPLSNRLLMVGLSKVRSLAWPEAEALLERLHATSESNELAFSQVLDRMGGSFEALKPDQKFRMFSLAARSNAPEFASKVGRDWFLNDSDGTVGTALELVRQLRPGPQRDELSKIGLSSTGPVSIAEFAAFWAPIRSDALVLELFQAMTPRIAGLTDAQVLTLVSQKEVGDLRDSMIMVASESVQSFSAEGLRNLFLACSSWSSRERLLATSFPRISAPAISVVAMAIQDLPVETGRDELLGKAAALSKSFSLSDLRAVLLASISQLVATQLMDIGLERLQPLTVSDAVGFSDTFDKTGFASEAFRDRMLLAAAASATDLTRGNLDQLLTRASSDLIRTKITQAAEPRLQKP